MLLPSRKTPWSGPSVGPKTAVLKVFRYVLPAL